MTQIGITVFVLMATLFFHLLEEMKTGFRKKYPLGEIPMPLLILINVIGYSLAISAGILCLMENQLGVLLSWIFAIAMFTNVIFHFGMIVYRKGYFPGGYTSILLLIVTLYLCYQLCNFK